MNILLIITLWDLSIDTNNAALLIYLYCFATAHVFLSIVCKSISDINTLIYKHVAIYYSY